MTSREPAQTVDDAAACWVARLDRGLTGGEQADLDSWLAGDTRHVGALARAKAIWLAAGHARSLGALVTGDTPAPAVTEAPSRRVLMMTAGGALAASLVAALGLPALLRRPRRLASGIGEIRRVPLGEGSVVTLDTGSVIETAFDATRRDVTLVSGVAFFDVARDPSRPFVVHARDVAVRAVGTAFSVSAIAGSAVAVVVSEGKVALTHGGAPILLAANMQAVVPLTAELMANRIVRPIAPAELERAMAWRDGMLAFEGDTLAQAAERFGRYGGPVIAVDDAGLAREPISGLFAASDPRGFTRAVALSLNARVVDGGATIRLVPKA